MTIYLNNVLVPTLLSFFKKVFSSFGCSGEDCHQVTANLSNPIQFSGLEIFESFPFPNKTGNSYTVAFNNFNIIAIYILPFFKDPPPHKAPLYWKWKMATSGTKKRKMVLMYMGPPPPKNAPSHA